MAGQNTSQVPDVLTPTRGEEETERMWQCRLVGRLVGAMLKQLEYYERRDPKKLSPLLVTKIEKEPWLWRTHLRDFRRELENPLMAPFVAAVDAEDLFEGKPTEEEKGSFWLGRWHGSKAYQEGWIRKNKGKKPPHSRVEEGPESEPAEEVDHADSTPRESDDPGILFEPLGMPNHVVAFENGRPMFFPLGKGGWARRQAYKGREESLRLTHPGTATGTGWPGARVKRNTEVVGFRLGADDKARLKRLIAAEPAAEGEKSQYLRILLREEEKRKSQEG